MALNRGKLSDVHRVGAGTSVGIVTVADNKKIYVKSIVCHASGIGIATATAQVYLFLMGQTLDTTNGPTKKSLMLIFLQERQFYLNHHIRLF